SQYTTSAIELIQVLGSRCRLRPGSFLLPPNTKRFSSAVNLRELRAFPTRNRVLRRLASQVLLLPIFECLTGRPSVSHRLHFQAAGWEEGGVPSVPAKKLLRASLFS